MEFNHNSGRFASNIHLISEDGRADNRPSESFLKEDSSMSSIPISRLHIEFPPVPSSRPAENFPNKKRTRQELKEHYSKLSTTKLSPLSESPPKEIQSLSTLDSNYITLVTFCIANSNCSKFDKSSFVLASDLYGERIYLQDPFKLIPELKISSGYVVTITCLEYKGVNHGKRTARLTCASRVVNAYRSLTENPVFKKIIQDSDRIPEGRKNFYLKCRIKCAFFKCYQSCRSCKVSLYGTESEELCRSQERDHQDEDVQDTVYSSCYIENRKTGLRKQATIFQSAIQQMLGSIPLGDELSDEDKHKITSTEFLVLAFLDPQNKIIIEAVMSIDDE